MAKRAEVTTHGRTKFGRDLLVFKPVWGIIGERRSSREPPRIAQPESRIFHPPSVAASKVVGSQLTTIPQEGNQRGGLGVIVQSRKRLLLANRYSVLR